MSTARFSFAASLVDTSKNFVVAIYASSAPSVLVDKKVPTKAGSPPYYTNPWQVTFTGLNAIEYILLLWESPDNTASGVVRNSTNFTPLSSTTSIRSDLYLEADVDAGLVSGTYGYVDPTSSLAGWEYSLEQIGYGTLEPGVDYSIDTTTHNWTLINGTKVEANQKFVMRFLAQIGTVIPPPPAQGGSGINAARIVTANETLTNADVNKALLIQGAGSSVALILPALSSVQDFDYMDFISAGGTHINASITSPGSDKIQRNQQVAKIVLGQNEQFRIFKFGGVWQVEYCSTEVDRMGQFFESYSSNPLKGLQMDGNLYQRSVYIRLYDWIVANGAVQIAEASWSNTDANGKFINQGYFTLGNGTTTFRVPKFHAYGFRRAVLSGAGAFQDQQFPDHKHGLSIGNLPGWAQGTGITVDVGHYNNHGTGPQDLTGKPTKSDGTLIPSAQIGAENRPGNTGIYLYANI